MKERRLLPDANALVDSAESFKNEKAGVLDEVLQAGNQEEVIHQDLKNERIFSSSQANIKRNVANFTVMGFKWSEMLTKPSQQLVVTRAVLYIQNNRNPEVISQRGKTTVGPDSASMGKDRRPRFTLQGALFSSAVRMGYD